LKYCHVQIIGLLSCTCIANHSRPCLLIDCSLLYVHLHFVVTMQGQKEAPPDMQCKDKFLLQSVVASPGATAKDITPEMVTIQHITNFELAIF